MMTTIDIRPRRLLAHALEAAVLTALIGVSACSGPGTGAPPEAAAARPAGASAEPVDAPRDALAGTWRLERVERYDQRGAPLSDLVHPTIGLAETLGFLLSDGERLGLILQEEARPAAGPGGGPASDDALAAVERYTAYFGPYTLDAAAGHLSQQVVGSLNPRLTGGRIEPAYALDADRLILLPGLQCPDSYVTDRGCAYGTTGIALRNVWQPMEPSADLGAAARRFLGFWEIDRLERRTPDGTALPTAQFAEGYLVYMPSGVMAVQLMRPDRRPWEGPRPTALEAHAARESYASYFGPFTVNAAEGVVVHHRIGNLDPGGIGTDAVRGFEFRDGQLILRPPVSTVDGQQVQTSVFWNRLSALPYNAIERAP